MKEASEHKDTSKTTVRDFTSLYSWFILLGVGGTWGSSYFFIKRALVAFDPMQVGSMRLALTFLCFIPFALVRLKTVKSKHWIPLLIVAVCGSSLPAFLFPIAQTQLSSSFTGVLSSTTPIFTLALGALFFSLKLTRQKVFGVAIGFMGAVSLIVLAGRGALEGEPMYALLACLATAFYALSSNTINTYLGELGTIAISSIAFLIIGVPATIISLQAGVIEVFKVDDAAWHSFAYVLALAVLGTAMATIFFFKLIKMSGVVFASTISYIIPCFAVFLGFLDGEPLTWVHAVGMALILCGIYMTSRR